MFGLLLGLGFFDSPKLCLTHKQTSLPIIVCDIELILTMTIAPITYLRNWALVVSIIIIRSMVNQCSFLFGALAQVNNNTFLF